MEKADAHLIKGMYRDTALSKFSSEFAYDAHNIRITARDNETLLSVTNERGTRQVSLTQDVSGTVIGYCVINDYVILFTISEETGCAIYRINMKQTNANGQYQTDALYIDAANRLKFNVEYPIETLGMYENENIQKVYWVDGINQPRVINIVKDQLQQKSVDTVREEYLLVSTPFDFIPELQLKESVIVTKEADSTGLFGAGCIQYAITYYNKYGQESNIAYVTPIYYTSFNKRAAAPDEHVGNAFRINIQNVDTNFEYLRIYSIFRTSLNTQPTVRRVTDIQLTSEIDDSQVVDEYALITNDSYIANGYTTSRNPFQTAVIPPLSITYMVSVSFDGGYSYEPFSSLDNLTYVSGEELLNPDGITSGKIPAIGSVMKASDSSQYAGFYVFDKNKTGEEHVIIRYPIGIDTYTYITYQSGNYLFVSRDPVYNNEQSVYIVSSESGSKIIGGSDMHYVRSDSTVHTNTVSYLDNGTTGDVIDPTLLLYVGGESIIPNTMTQKDNTLFLGNYKLNRKDIGMVRCDDLDDDAITTDVSTYYYKSEHSGAYYRWGNTLNAVSNTSTNNIAFPGGFKSGEKYRLGIQFQYINGKWSDPVYLDDCIQTEHPTSATRFLPVGSNNLVTRDDEYQEVTKPVFKMSVLPQSVTLRARRLGYVRVRPVVVFPNIAERLVVTQGLVCPTVYNLQDRKNGTPYAQSSWFLRPFVQSASNNTNIEQGASVQFNHNHTLYSYIDKGAEIQGVPQEFNDVQVTWTDDDFTLSSSVVYDSERGYKIKVDANTYDYADKNSLSSVFAVDQSILDLHTPEIEFDDTFKVVDYSDVKFRVIGYAEFDANIGDIDIDTSSATISTDSNGFMHRTLGWKNTYQTPALRQLVAGLFYQDYLADEAGRNNDDNAESVGDIRAFPDENYPFLYMVYPWHKNGSLNNDMVRASDKGTRSALLKRKIISNLKYSRDIVWFDNAARRNLTISKPQLFSSDQVSLVKIPSGQNQGKDYTYYGNVDTLLTASTQYGVLFSAGHKVSGTSTTSSLSYQLDTSANEGLHMPSFSDTNTLWKFTKNAITYIGDQSITATSDIGDLYSSLRCSREAVRMKYKTAPHFVFKLQDANVTMQSVWNDYENPSNCLFIGELYRETSDNIFGGTTDEALRSNMWIPAGEARAFNSGGRIKDTDGETNAELVWEYGDTFYQRYDVLKSFPFTNEDQNSIVEIGSFMCETRINIDGRYDPNRGLVSNIYITPKNFNLINDVYSQTNNFFNYKQTDTDFYKLNNFPTQLTITKEKTMASDVDAWTNINLASTLDLDGDKGEITSLNTFNSEVFAFQRNGISNILFNSRVQIPTSSGAPIEITNSYKLDGKRYISDAIGCDNKWSIAEAPSGMYFVDSRSNALYHFDGKLTDISSKAGFHTWIKQNVGKSSWYPNIYGNFRTFYDHVYNDVYVTTADTALCFSEKLGAFTSFMSYGHLNAMFNVANRCYSIPGTSENESTSNLWQNYSGDYNSFYGTIQPFDVTVVSNLDYGIDKIFDTVEFRADRWQPDNQLATNVSGSTVYSKEVFSYIHAWNEYQDTGEISLKYKYVSSSNLKQKYRVWRSIIPRNAISKRGKIPDRIRNTWACIKLGWKPDLLQQGYSNTDKIELHDITVRFFE